MASLVSHREGRGLEPSAGAGNLVAILEQQRPHLHIDAVEIDSRLERVCETPITVGDFFAFSDGRDGTYDVVFGNPPYVSWKEVEDSTRASASSVKSSYSDKTNLYHLFIDRCADLLARGGEMVFIVPKEWLYLTSAAPLRNKLGRLGAITHFVDCGEENLFADAAVPALLIFRWVRGAKQGSVSVAASTADAVGAAWTKGVLTASGERWMLVPGSLKPVIAGWGKLSDQFVVRVGLITGLDRVYKLGSARDVEPSCAQMQVDTTRQMVPFLNVNDFTALDAIPPKAAATLRAHEDELRARRITRFHDGNWWRYGAVRNEEWMQSDDERFFGLVKTRSPEPFFTVPGAKYFTGGVLGVFRRDTASVSVATAVRVLNAPAFRPVLEAMFLTSGNKVSLQPATLMDVPFPRSESDALAFLESVN